MPSGLPSFVQSGIMKEQHLLNSSIRFLAVESQNHKNKWLVLADPYVVESSPKPKSIWEGYNYFERVATQSKVWWISFSMMLFALVLPAHAQTPVTNLRVKQTISTQRPAINDVVTYTMVVSNALGYTPATGVRVMHTLPTNGASYVPASASVLRGSGSYNDTSGQWSVGTIAPGDSVVLVVRATVQGRGVFYNIAEVVAADLPDITSIPNNHVITEKDYDAVCFSVPIRLFQGDEFTVTMPSGYGQITWYRNDQSVRTLPSSVAVVNTDSSLTIKSTGTYRFVTVRNGCQALSCCDIEVIPACNATLDLTLSANTSICTGQTANLIATASLSTAQIRWYLSPSDGTPFANTSSGAPLPVTPSVNTVYYAEAFTADGCVSVRKPVTVTVTTVVTPVLMTSNLKNICPITTVDLSTVAITNSSTGLTYEWYTSASRSQGTQVTNLTTAGAGTYYVFAKSGNCYSSPAVLTVSIVDCNCQSVAGVTIGSGLTVCSGDAVPIKATLSGAATSLTWTSNGTGNFSNPTSLTTTYTPSAADLTLSMITLTATTNDPDGSGLCQPGTSSAIIKINKRPDAPTGVAVETPVVCRSNSTKLVGYTAGGSINWYNASNALVGSTVSGGKLVITPLAVGSEIYYAEAVSAEGCTSPLRSSVTVTTSNCQTDLAVLKQVITPGPYQVGQKITYSVTASNLGDIDATNTRVTDALPASLSYVSSTPAGQYNPATSTWMIGTLGAGMNRNLLIEATILVAGSIKNTAIISSPENDPKRTDNDTSSVIIPVGPCVVQAPTIICGITEICKGGTTTLGAKGCEGGTIKWSDGKTGMTIFATPSVTTTYTASCVTGECTSGPSNSITVTVIDPQPPVITASADQVCPGTSVTLTAAGCAGGVIEWSDKAQTGVSILVMPNSKTTYTAQCRINSCLSNPAIKTIDIAADLPMPTITASETAVCPGETVTLTVMNCVGTPVWNSTMATTASIIVTPTATNNSYYVYCKNGACISKTSAVATIQLVTPTAPVVTASADSVCSQGLVTLTATGCNGTVVWSVTGKTGSVITVNPQATTSYSAQCKVQTCLSDASNTVTVKVLTPTTPIIATTKTMICSGEKVTLTATGCQGGTVNWYPINRTGTSLDLYPTATTEYYATCKQGNCESEPSNRVRLTVNTGTSPAPAITASTATLCSSGLVSLTATGCPGGTVQWSDGQTGPVVSVSVTPTNHEFYALCKTANQCGSGRSNTISINITATGVAAPTVIASASAVCSGEKMTLTANGCQGTVQWYGVSQTGASIDIYPTATQTYYAVCNQGGCTSSASNTVVVAVNTGSSPAPVIEASTTAVCGSGLVSLTATGCTGGIIQWSDGQTGSVVSVSATATNKEFYALCKTINQCGSGKSNVIAIQINPANVPTPTVATSTTSICSGEKVTLIATGCQGAIQWYGVNRTGASIDVYPTSTQTYYAICSQAGCSSPASNTVTVVVNTGSSSAPIITASTMTMCGSGMVSLTATGCTGGIIQWSDGQTGPVVSVSVTPMNKEFYAICKTTSQCGSGRSNTISINVTPSTTPSIERCVCSNDTICPGENVKLTVKNCQGIPHWSTSETTTSIIVSPAVTTSYSIYCQEGTCKSNTSAQYVITVIPVTVPTITASATVVTPGSNVTLTASGCAGEIVWSANDINGNNKGAILVVRPVGTQTYYVQCKFRQCLSDPSIAITVNPVGCVVNAGTLSPVNPTVCATNDQSITLSAKTNGGMIQPNGYSLLYVLAKEGVVLKTSAIPSFTVASAAARYVIHTLVYDATVGSANYVDLSKVTLGVSTTADVQELIKGRCAALDPIGAKIEVNRVDPPRLYSTSSLTVCHGSKVTLGAIGCSGGTVTWSDGSIGETIEKTITSNLWLMATCTVNGCTSGESKSIDVHITNTPIPLIVSNHSTICIGETVSLTATGCQGGTYVWSDGKTVGNTLALTPNADVSYRVKCKVGDCEGDWSAYTTIKVGAPSAPSISIAGTNNTTVCFGSPVTLTAQGCSPDGYVTWSNNQVGNSITVSPTSSTTFTARCYTSGQCISASSNVVALTVLMKVIQPAVKDITNSCPAQTAELAKAITSIPATSGGVFEYYSDVALTQRIADPVRMVGGTYYVIERSVNGCVSLPAAIHVQITACTGPTPCDTTNPATANAGVDAITCAGETYRLSGSMGGSGKTAHWTTSGNGSFDNAFSMNAVYTASADDVMAGKVTLTLSVSTNNSACPIAKDEMVLTFKGIKTKPVIAVMGRLNLCYGDSVILTASAGAAGYRWSSGQITQSIAVKTSGTYSVQLIDGTGCSSLKSDAVTVKVNEPVLPPLVHNLRNTCPAKIVDLTKALSMTTVGTSYTYRICACNTSNIVIRPDSVCEGTYWVVAKDANGCVSAPAKVVVKVFDCTADTLDANVSITKLASTALIQNNAPVNYTLTVGNAGPHTARNIDVRDVLPKGLELVPTTASSYSVSYGVLTQHIDSLKAGQSRQIMYAARLLVKGQPVVNTAEIVYLDNKDPNLDNNISSVTVTDNTPRRSSQIGVAKAVLGQPTTVGDSIINVSYRFVISNFGDDTLRKVQVADDLAYSFSPNKILEAKISLPNANSSLRLSSSFTGMGTQTNMLDSVSRLAPGKSEVIVLAVMFKRATGDTTRSFRNYAAATAVNSLTSVSDISTDGGDADPDGDGNPTNNTSAASFTLGVLQAQGPSIGLALAVVKVESQPDSSYLVTYKATIKNYGTITLRGVTLTDSLSKAFGSPASYKMVGTPVVGGGSTLVVNALFNGSTQPNLLMGTSTLGVGVQDTVLITVKVKPNGNNGPFYSSATVTGHTPDSTQIVKDVSNNGLDPTPAGSTSTAVRFDLPKGLLGVAKSVGTPLKVENGVFDIPYIITVSNMGTVALKNVQIEDDLSKTFGHGALIISNQIAVTATGTSNVKVNPAYTGQGMVTKMLIDSMSALPVGMKTTLRFTVRVNVKHADSLTFYNTAKATGVTSEGNPVEDISTSGVNNDPDNDLDPRNNNQPTPIALNGSSTTSFLGLAMSVRDTTRQADGSYHVTYQIVAKAYGPDPLKNVTITDSLAQVFNTQTGATYSVVGSPLITSSGSALQLNPAFNGGSDPVLVVGDSTSQLAAGHADTLLVVLSVSANGSTTTFLNSAYGQALAKSGLVSEVSTSGLEPDPNGNGNPTDSNEREATALTLPPSYLSVFIPEGFSPNGDGVNDEFVLRGVSGLTVSLEVYNRWGHLVYQNADYRNDWDGKPNAGILPNGNDYGVPDGTYYYVIKLSDGRKFVRYMTINR